MKPARYIIHETDHTWIKRQAQQRDTSASAVVRAAIALLRTEVVRGSLNLDQYLAQLEDNAPREDRS